MIGREGQTAGQESRDRYEAVVLDFLNKEMAAVQLTQERNDPSIELDALVSDLLKQIMTESDQPQPFKNAAPAVLEASLQEPRSQDAQECDPFEDSQDPLSEYMRLQERRAAENGDTQPDLGLDAGQFEAMDDVLAEYMPSEPVAAESRSELCSLDTDLHADEFADGDAIPPEFMGAQQTTGTPGVEAEPARTGEELTRAENTKTSPAGRTIAQEKASSSGKPASNPVDKSSVLPAASSEPAVKTRKVGIQADRNEAANVARPSAREKGAHSGKNISGRAVSFAPPAFAAPRSRRSIVLLITIASLCVLAALAIPAYFSPTGGPRATDSQRIASATESTAHPKAGASGEIPAIPILQLSPNYPESAIKLRASASVVLELSIDGEGNVVKATPMSGSELFHEEAVNTVMKWRYKPATVAGKNVASKSRVTLNFNLRH